MITIAIFDCFNDTKLKYYDCLSKRMFSKHNHSYIKSTQRLQKKRGCVHTGVHPKPVKDPTATPHTHTYPHTHARESALPGPTSFFRSSALSETLSRPCHVTERQKLHKRRWGSLHYTRLICHHMAVVWKRSQCDCNRAKMLPFLTLT